MTLVTPLLVFFKVSIVFISIHIRQTLLLVLVQYYVVGYKGSSPYDAGLFYCPYVPLQMVRAVGENTFQPKIGFKTRYGMVANPFAKGAASGAVADNGALNSNSTAYYRRVKVLNLM
jgi:hypothetical protein